MGALEKRARLFLRMQLQTKEDLKVKAGEWHTLKIATAGDHIECFVHGEKYLEANDSTFQEPGKVGLWTKADAQTYFDNLKIVSK